MQVLRKAWWNRPPWDRVPALAAAGAVAAVVTAAQFAGAFQAFDLFAYDHGLRLRAQPNEDSRFVLIEVGEEDLAARGWPLTDADLAALLEVIEKGHPRAVGVDIYRDRPVPPGTKRLSAFLRSHGDVVWVDEAAAETRGEVAPPATLRGTGQTAFADLVTDPDGAVRRTLLYLNEPGKPLQTSFALACALRFLKPLGIFPRPEPGRPEILRLGATSIPPLEADDGGYDGIDARGYQMLLDFAEGRDRFGRYSLRQAMTGAIPPQDLGGKIVLVGVTAHSVSDYFRSPLGSGPDGSAMERGLVFHAQAAAQMVRLALGLTPLTRGIGDPAKAALIVLSALLGAAAGAVRPGALGFAAAAGGAAIALVLGWYAALAAYLWLPLAGPLVALLASAALTVAYLSYRERAERALLMGLFAAQVSRPVADEIWRLRHAIMEDGRLKAQRLIATVLFSDVAGFTPVAERLGAEGVMAWLEGYMDRMARVVGAHDGVVLRFIGDAILAAFGAPVPRTGPDGVDKDAAQAVTCALVMRHELDDVNARLLAEGLPPIAMRIGIFTGEVVAGTIGSAHRQEYSIIGDAVNAAARLQNLGKSVGAGELCPILVGESTFRCLTEAIAARPMGEVTLKGKNRKIKVYQILGEADEPRPSGQNGAPRVGVSARSG